MRKFSEGGFSADQEEWLTRGGQSPDRTDPYILARMRSAVPDAPKAPEYKDESMGEFTTNIKEPSTPVTKTVTKTSVTAAPKSAVTTPAAPKVDMEAERARIKEIQDKQKLESVHPEDYINPAGFLKGMFKQVVKSGVKRAETATANAAAKNVTRKAEEGFNPSEALDTLKPTRNVSVKGKDIPVKQGNPSFGGSTQGMGVKEATNKSGKKIPVKRQQEEMLDDGGSGAFKRGGVVRSSASRRADGCAIRGKTRA